MLPAVRRCEVVLGKLGVLMLRHAVAVWLGRWSNFLRRMSATIAVVSQSFKGVFGHYEEMADLRCERSIDQHELRAHSKPTGIGMIGCNNHVRDIGSRP